MDDKESKVKKIVFSVIAACSLFALFGCNHRAETDTVQPAAMEELKPMQQSWRGVLPCADCEGIDTSLFLEKDGTWVMNEHYQGARREPSSFASYGTWARTADKLVLTNSKGEPLALIPNRLVVPPALEKAALDITEADFINGTRNTMKGTAKPLVVPQLAGSDTAWFLLCTTLPIKPLIYQQRKKVKFVSKTNETDDNVFMSKTFVYGADSRGNAGFGFWQMAYGSDGTAGD